MGPGPNPNVQARMFLQRPSNPNHNHAYFYNHEWWAQGPTLKYKHECFYNDPVTLITTMHISRAMSAGPFGPRAQNVKPCIFLQRPSNPNHNHACFYNHECWALGRQGPTLMYNHECFYNDQVTLITTMHVTTTTRAGPLGPRAQP